MKYVWEMKNRFFEDLKNTTCLWFISWLSLVVYNYKNAERKLIPSFVAFSTINLLREKYEFSGLQLFYGWHFVAAVKRGIYYLYQASQLHNLNFLLNMWDAYSPKDIGSNFHCYLLEIVHN